MNKPWAEPASTTDESIFKASETRFANPPGGELYAVIRSHGSKHRRGDFKERQDLNSINAKSMAINRRPVT